MWVELATLAVSALQSGQKGAAGGGGGPAVTSGPSSGDWNVNLGGSGVAFQGGEALGTILLIAGAAVVAIWLLKPK